MAKKIVIVGGSYSGVKAGKTLHKLFKHDDHVEITLIDKNNFHTLMTELHEVAGHRTEPESVQINLQKIFAGRKVNVVRDSIKEFDFSKNQLKSDNGTYSYDYLIMGAGNEPNFFGVEGAEENSFTLWSFEDAVLLRNHIEDMFAQASTEKDSAKRKQLLTFAVCGGGFTGVEMVGEIGEAKKHLSRKYNIDEKEVTIYNIEAMNRILNMLKNDAQVAKVEKRYKKLGIQLLKNSPVVKVGPDSVTLKDGTEIPTKTLIWTTGIKNKSTLSQLGFDLGRGGRIVVNESLQPLKDGKAARNVFVIGDSASYEDETGPLPQIVEAAEQTGHTAAMNVAALIKDESLHKHKQDYHGFMVSIGSQYAVAETGFNSSGWLAVLIKHIVNIYYQIGVAGIRQVWNYLRHEFFHVKNRRSVFGGLFSSSSKNIWKLPLRLWLGYMWVVEGMVKIGEGWLESPKVVDTINAIAGYASNAGDVGTATPGAAAQVAEAAEAVTAATGGAGTIVGDVGNATAEAANQLHPFFQWAVDHEPAGFGDAIMNAPKWMVNMVNSIIKPIEVPFQTMMVVGEIVIGLCLIFGLFTFLASLVSVGMGIGIAFTGMADASMIWYIVCAIALMEGAGRALGLDYYVIPAIKRWWSKLGFVKKSYLYFDEFEEK
ncbi:FAD-dependent oxidoreductase [Alkalibaculum bacchi]|uniref:FAD-dependent oxidoreductase n=1 Tax=Alkalibaculum bacchi TaxID=645887 RepID=UPI0026EDBF8E|nr:FAD-dependent oxidoreductase [Alkalibaculum bacchi]